MHNNVLKKKSGKISRGKIAKNKDAFSSVMLFIIIALVAFVVLFAFILSTTSKSDYEIRKERCKASVKTQAFVETKFPDLTKKLDCPTEHLTIKGRDQDEMKRQLADQMYDCWDKMGQHKAQLWGDTDGEKFCIVCSVTEFKDKKNSLEDFPRYLAMHRPAYNDKEYFILFNGQSPDAFLQALDKNPVGISDDIDMSKDYAVIYTFLTKDQKNKMERGEIGAAGGTALGVGIAAIGVATGGIGFVAIATVFTITSGGGFIIGYFTGKDLDWDTYIGVVSYEPEVLDAFNCIEIPTEVAVRG